MFFEYIVLFYFDKLNFFFTQKSQLIKFESANKIGNFLQQKIK
jgi:hypothetical protein